MTATPTKTVYLDQIAPNPWNPHGMTHEELESLKSSLRENGQWRPILVIELDAPDEHTPDLDPAVAYRIIDGEHLHRAMVSNALAGTGPDEALVFVFGKNSEIPAHRQMEIGQTINHGGRGSLEDLSKTGKVIEKLLEFRSLEEISRRTGQALNFLEAARRVASPLPRRAADEPVKVRTSQERKGQTVPLVFEDNDSLAEYQRLITAWEAQADPDKTLTPGRRRIAAVLLALGQGQA